MMTQGLFCLYMLFYVHVFYACDESKLREKSEIVDLTSELDCAHDSGLVLTPEPYPGVSSWRSVPRADGRGVFFTYNLIDRTSPLYQRRARAVEHFVPANPVDSLKAVFYSKMLCPGMDVAKSTSLVAVYCHKHHCFQHTCLPLYADQASLLQPSDLKMKDVSGGSSSRMEFNVHGHVKLAGVMMAAPGKSVVRSILHRQAGMRTQP